MEVNAGELTRDLKELVAALDRRVRRVERAGEAAIARDAAALRAKAVARLAELTTNPVVGPEPDLGAIRPNTAGRNAKNPVPGKSL
jgi:hypothetical protein